MKKINSLIKLYSFLLIVIFPLLAAGCTYQESQSVANQTNPPDGYNLDDLNNYGEWIHIASYGDCWRPYVVADWMPFENGYWAYADANWTWVSYEPFGWIVYHYGYWYNDSFYGWVWIPSNNDWSAARVDWISYDDYIGWAPLPPPGVVYGSPWEARAIRYWDVVRIQDFDKEDVGTYRVQNPVRNTMGGRDVSRRPPLRKIIETTTGRNFNPIRIQQENVKIQKRELMKINLPPAETQKVERNSPRIKENVLVPREKYREQQQQRKKERR